MNSKVENCFHCLTYILASVKHFATLIIHSNQDVFMQFNKLHFDKLSFVVQNKIRESILSFRLENPPLT